MKPKQQQQVNALPPPPPTTKAGLRLRSVERERTIQAPGGARYAFSVEDGYDIIVQDGIVVLRKDDWAACFAFAGCHGTPLL